MKLLVCERVIGDMMTLVMEQLCKSGVSPLADANGKWLVVRVALVGDSHTALIVNTDTNRQRVSRQWGTSLTADQLDCYPAALCPPLHLQLAALRTGVLEP